LQNLVVAGGLLAIVASIQFVVLFKHVKGKVYRMSPDEAKAAMFYGLSITNIRSPGTPLWVGPAVGYVATLSCNIDTLRKAARRGDRLTFWFWPTMMTGWCGGLWLIFLAVMMAARIPTGLIVLVTVFMGSMVAIVWFMAWAALYTKIDLDVDSELPPSQSPPAPPPRPERVRPGRRPINRSA
jgi:hypothetical protein